MRSLLTIFILAGLLGLASTALTYWIAVDASHSDTALIQNQAVIDSLKDTLSTFKDAETGQRGFLLTGESEYLEPYQIAVAQISKDLASIDAYAASGSISAEDAKTVEQLGTAKLAELAQTIALRRDQGFEPAVTVVKAGTGKQAMDDMRKIIDRMIDAEAGKQTALRQASVRASFFRTIVFTIIGAINISFLIWAFRKIRAGILELQRQRELLAVTLASIGDGVIVTDTQSNVTFLNPEGEKLTGWSSTEAQGHPCDKVFNIVNETSRQRVESPVEKVLRLGVVVGLANHTLLLRRDGTEIAIDDSGAPIRNADGTIGGAVLVFRDFTAHKSAEKKVNDAFHLLTAVTNSTADLIYAKDENSRMLFANKATLTVVGKTLEQVTGKNEAEWHGSLEEAQAIMENDRRIRESGQVQTSEEIFTGPFGTKVYLSTKSPLVDETGRVYGIVGVSRDMTEQKIAEANLVAAMEATQAASIAKDNFLATLSHELRTPLTPVLTTLNIWESKGELTPELVPDVQMMRRNIELEARLIDDLLDLTRIVKGKLPLNLETTDVHSLIEAVTAMYQSDIHSKRLRLTLNLSAEQHHVCGDTARLQQVFWNILKNSTKFTPEGGRIDVSSKNDSGGRVKLTFHDTGIGMTPETMAVIFEPFEQGSAEMVRQYGGLGLGMAISRALLEAQKGEIEATSDGLGEGSTFTVTLGCVAPPELNHCAPSSSNALPVVPKPLPLSILLVEDHADTARAMSRLLRAMGHEVRVAGSVSTAIESAFRNFDLLLSDIGLPDGNGVDLIRQIRQQRGDSFMAVALTGFGMDDDIVKCKEAGFNEHLTKPVNLQKLELVMQSVTASRTQAT